MAQIQNNYLNCDYLNVSQIIFKKSYLRLNIAQRNAYMKHISNKKIDTKNIKIFTIYFNKSMHVLIFFSE